MTPDERTALNEAVCIHQGEDGTVCGLGVDVRYDATGGALIDIHPVIHPFVPGRKCPTCDGTGYVMRVRPGAEHHNGCPTCADSPVRGYVELSEKEVE